MNYTSDFPEEFDNETLAKLCPQYTLLEKQMIKYTSFWLDGVAKTSLAIIGILSNCLAFHVLNKPKMRNSFNKCLMALAFIDSIFLTLGIIESFRRRWVIWWNRPAFSFDIKTLEQQSKDIEIFLSLNSSDLISRKRRKTNIKTFLILLLLLLLSHFGGSWYWKTVKRSRYDM